MKNRKDYEKRLGERLEAAYMQENIGPVMSREEFHRLIQTAEKKKKHRRTMLSLAAACVALCLVCGGFVAGMTMRESASAGKDDETKTVQQGGSVVIGSGVSQNDQNVGVSTKTYTNIEDIPEDIRKEIHFLDSDEFELEKVKVTDNNRVRNYQLYYFSCSDKNNCIEITEKVTKGPVENQITVLPETDAIYEIDGINIYLTQTIKGDMYYFQFGNTMILISLVPGTEIEKETIIEGLLSN